MGRALRIEISGARFHVTARGNERRKTFRDDRDREQVQRNAVLAQCEQSGMSGAKFAAVIVSLMRQCQAQLSNVEM